MKILLVNRFLYRKGGSEAVFFNMAALLQSAGHEVVLFGYEDEANIGFPAPVYTYRPASGLAGKIAGVQNYFNNRSAASRLDYVLEKERPDIVHLHLFIGSFTPAIIDVCHARGIPVVHTVHDYRMVCPAYTFRDGKGRVCEKCKGGRFTECFRNRCSKGNLAASVLMTCEMYYRNRKWHPSKSLDGVIYVSNFSKQKHESMDPAFASLANTVLYNFSGLQLRHPSDNRGYYLYFGRLSGEKGPRTLLEAFRDDTRHRLVVVGSGPLENELRAAYPQSNIEFKGFMTGEALYDCVRGARFVCVPSECYENNPMSVVESYSLGIPVIGSRLGGIPEIVEDGKTGFLFGSADVQSLKDAIARSAAVDDSGYEAMCMNAKAFADRHFNPDNYVKELLPFYKSVIASWMDRS